MKRSRLGLANSRELRAPAEQIVEQVPADGDRGDYRGNKHDFQKVPGHDQHQNGECDDRGEFEEKHDHRMQVRP